MILKEYQFLQYKYEEKENYVNPKTFEELERFVLDNEETAQYLKISTKKGYGKVLQAQNYVGVIQAKDGTTIEILPKILNLETDKDGVETKKVLIKMLKTLKDSPFKDFNMANLQSTKMPLLEIFITMFLKEITLLVQKGIKSDYVIKEDNLKFLKGKLKINEQVSKNYIHKERFYVEYQEYTSDRIENRLIKTTLEYLYKRAKTNNNKKRIREFLFVFDDIKVSHNIKSDFSKVKINRQMKDYTQILLWCKTFLLANSFSPYKGKDIAFALLFDMNLLFESYVLRYLKKVLVHNNVKGQDKTHHLAYLDGKTAKFLLKPDIVIDNGNIIADTKWKILSEDKTHQGISQGDMYQLYAYGTKYKKCNYMYLIYPKDSNIDGNSYNYFNSKDEQRLKDELHLNILFFDVQKCEFIMNKDYELYRLMDDCSDSSNYENNSNVF